MNIGSVEFIGRVALAPMAGVADRAFRELCVAFGASYVVGEMVSAKGLCMNDKKSEELLRLSEQEHPAAVQLFGDNPVILAEAAQKALRFSPEIIDLNMGCPAPKIAGNGGGAALMKDPGLAQRIVKAVVQAVPLPVTVKLRAGWDENSINAVEVAKRCEEAGAAAITVHGRTRMQMYAPPVFYNVIRAVKQAVKIPVIGNGEITDAKSAAFMLDETGCDMVMVGRGALGNPWIFSEINAFLADGRILPPPPLSYRMQTMLRHIQRLCALKGEYIGIREARKHAAWYMKGIRGAASLRAEIGKLESFTKLQELAINLIKRSASENEPAL